MEDIFFKLQEACEEMNEELARRSEEAKRIYWEAVKFPRKTKKRIRKKAVADALLYVSLLIHNRSFYSDYLLKEN